MTRWLRSALAWLSLAGSLLAGARAEAEPQLDLALVIAVDVSSSMAAEELGLQRNGYVEAFRSALVHEAIRNGPLGRIAVTYVEWSGEKDQEVVVPWTVIDGPEKARFFADRLTERPLRQAETTSISSVIDFGRELLASLGGNPTRRVIDISGDGPNNEGRQISDARDDAVAEGITINGLPIMYERPGSILEVEDLDLYYQDCVIGGAGAFMLPLRDSAQFAMMIRAKIMREIAGTGDHSPLIVPVQARMDCTTGEKRKGVSGPGERRSP